jgi:uncharacterized repeat protein (TIGR02543 family)
MMGVELPSGTYKIVPGAFNNAGTGDYSLLVVAPDTPAVVGVTLTTTAVPAAGGTVTGSGVYDSETVVPVIATPNAGFAFDNWSGACTGTGPCNVTMDDDKTVTAHFSQVGVVPSRSITIGQEVSGTIAEAGEFEPWLLEVAEDITVDIYMWAATRSLDTHVWLYEGVVTSPSASYMRNNDDNNGAIQTAVALGILPGPVSGSYNSAMMGVQLTSGTYSIVPRSYNNRGTGDYSLLVVAPNQ